jgi:signal recognition particle receptor subunit beta
MGGKKIVFFGSVGAGKTTAIRAISEVECINTDASTSDSTSERKGTTTVAMDYGYVTSATNQRVHCYGTPGQERFQFMWEIIASQLAPDCSGQILFLDNSRKYPQQDLNFYTQHFRHLLGHKPLIIAVTKSDIDASPTQSQYKGWLEDLDIDAPVYFIDAREKYDILFLLDELIPEFEPARTQIINAPVIEDDISLDQVIQYSAPKVEFSEEILNKISVLQGVKGVALINPKGQLHHSTVENDLLVELLQFLTKDTTLLQDTNYSDSSVSLTLASEDNYHYVINCFNGFVLAVLCLKQVTKMTLRQQIDNLLQW